MEIEIVRNWGKKFPNRIIRSYSFQSKVQEYCKCLIFILFPSALILIKLFSI